MVAELAVSKSSLRHGMSPGGPSPPNGFAPPGPEGVAEGAPESPPGRVDADAVATSPETLFEFGDESSSFAVGARAVATLRADAPFDAVVVYIDAEDDVDPFDPERDAFATPFSIARRRQGVLIVPERSRAPSLQVWCAAVPGDEGFRFGILASS